LDRLEGGPKPPKWLDDATPSVDDQVWFAFNMDRFRRDARPQDPRNLFGGTPLQMVGPLLNETGRVVASAQIRPKLSIRAAASCKSADSAKRVQETRDIPWTKPVDIPYSPDKPLPQLGGYSPGGFNAVFSDGYARFLSDKIDETTMRRLIEKADGNRVELPARGAR
jgi:hypothetical protein